MDNNSAVNEFVKIRPLYQRLARKVALIVEELMELKKINFHAVSFRAKTVDSFSEKIKNPKYNDPLNDLTDLAGIRIIGYVENDIKQICKIIEEIFVLDPKNSLDKSEELGVDKVGYKSIHYICSLSEDRICLPEYERFKDLKFEIQIRTILQHSWAEVGHDKNYKFSGELPAEIQRRFALIAGSLELADREFNRLSNEIDDYAEKVRTSTEKGELKIPLNSTSLKHYLCTKFEQLINQGTLEPDFNGSENENIMLNEFRRFGIKTLDELDKLIDEKFMTTLLANSREDNNLLGLSRLILMYSSVETYFKKSYSGVWRHLSPETEYFLSALGIKISEIEKYLDNYFAKKK